MNKKLIDQVAFTITGDFMTEHFRSLVPEGNWRQAIEGLQESLVGITKDQCEQVLSGHKKFIGTNELDFVDDDSHQDPNFIKTQYYPYYAGLSIDEDSNTFFKSYDFVDRLTQDDVHEVYNKYGFNSIPVESAEDPNAKMKFQYLRAETYLNNPSRDLAIAKNNGFKLLEPVTPDYPSWLKQDEFKKMVLKQNSSDCKSIKIRNGLMANINFYAFASGVEARSTSVIDTIRQQIEIQKQDPSELAEKVRKQAEEKGGFLKFEDKENGITYEIPKNPFLKWCLSDHPISETIEWDNVCQSGMKCIGDDPNHTDWFLLTGLDLEYAEDSNHHSNKFFSELRYDYSMNYTNANLKQLLRGKGRNFDDAEIVHVESALEVDKIKPNSIIVISTASPEFEGVAHRCAESKSVLITEVGGSLSHLSIVGREFGLQMYMLPDAKNKLIEGNTASIDSEYSMINIHEYRGKVFKDKISEKIRKRNGLNIG